MVLNFKIWDEFFEVIKVLVVFGMCKWFGEHHDDHDGGGDGMALWQCKTLNVVSSDAQFGENSGQWRKNSALMELRRRELILWNNAMVPIRKIIGISDKKDFDYFFFPPPFVFCSSLCILLCLLLGPAWLHPCLSVAIMLGNDFDCQRLLLQWNPSFL